MAYILKDGQGSLFKNEKKTSDNHPNARGELMIEGVLYEVAAWTKQGSKGPFQSLSVKRKEGNGGNAQERIKPVEKSRYDDPFDEPF